MVSKIFSIFLVLSLCLTLAGQQAGVSLQQLSKKDQKTYSKALNCLAKGETTKGIQKLEELVAKNPTFRVGLEKLNKAAYKAGHLDKSLNYLQQLRTTFPEQKRYYFWAAEVHEELQDFDAALEIINELAGHPELSEETTRATQRRIGELQFRKTAYTTPLDIKPIRLEGQINSTDMEYHPGFSADGETMVFVRVSSGKFKQEDLYITHRTEQDSFELSRPISNINTPEFQEGAFTLSQDGQILVFTGCGQQGSVGGCDLYISFRKGDNWTRPKNLGPKINSRFWDAAPTFSSDSRTLFFASKRPGGLGGSDIWKVELDASNNWQDPVNLGDKVNTPENDESPFLHPDGKTLYFVSDGHIGMGSYDIFISRLEGEEWSAPKNLGYPINTSEREGGLFINLQGQRAYYSSQLSFVDTINKEQTGGDIFYFDLPTALRPQLVTYIKFNVTDAVTGSPLQSQVVITDLDSTTVTQSISTNQAGTTTSIIDLGRYAISVNKKGYLFHSENVDLDQVASSVEPINYNIALMPIVPETKVVLKESKPIVLNNIFFETGSATLLPESDTEITTLTTLLQDNPSLIIRIIGHTDNVGRERDNLILSENRAKAVYSRILSAGVMPNRLSYLGKGEAEPIATNDTTEGRAKNRRTEFIVISQ